MTVMIQRATLLVLFAFILVLLLAECKPVTAYAQLHLRRRRHGRVLTAELGDGATGPRTELSPGVGGAGGGLGENGEDSAPGAGSEAPSSEGAGCSCHWPPRGGRKAGGGGGHGGRGGGEGSGDGGSSECHCRAHSGGGGGWNGGGGDDDGDYDSVGGQWDAQDGVLRGT